MPYVLPFLLISKTVLIVSHHKLTSIQLNAMNSPHPS